MSRTNEGTWELMNYSDRVNVVLIMREYLKEVNEFYTSQYYRIKTLASIDLNDLILECEEPDLSSFYKDNANYKFTKLMGGI